MKTNLRDTSFEIIPIKELKDGCIYRIIVKVPLDFGWIERMRFICESDSKSSVYPLKHLKNKSGYVYFGDEIFLTTCALYKYYFSFEVNRELIYLKKDNKTSKNSINADEKFNLSVNFNVPSWAKGKIMYHIFVDRFNKGKNDNFKPMKDRIIHKSLDEEIIVGPDKNGRWNNDFYGGNINGIIDKLDYIKSLGVSILYLSPIVRSQSNHRYDTADYEEVDPYVGTNEDLKRLCDEAHKKGMKVILDAVFNHTGNDSKYFNEYGNYKELGAFQSKESKYYPFYKKNYYDGKVNFEYWWGMGNLPECDGDSIEWKNYICGKNGIIDKWFSLGIDGLRLDVADELTDEFIENIRIAVKRNKEDGFILGEVWENPMRMNRTYISSGKGMDTIMNYKLIDALIRYYKYNDISKLERIINEIENEYPKETIDSLMNFTSTHDISRIIDILGTNEFSYYANWVWDPDNSDREYQKRFKLTKEQYIKSIKIYKSYLLSLSFLRGNLSIFYGDEVGLEGLGNLANRRYFPWNNIDKDLLEYFKVINKIRNNEKLSDADFKLLDINDRYLMYERINNDSKLLVVSNKTDSETILFIPEEYMDSEKLFSLNDSNKYRLNSFGGLILKKK